MILHTFARVEGHGPHPVTNKASQGTSRTLAFLPAPGLVRSAPVDVFVQSANEAFERDPEYRADA